MGSVLLGALFLAGCSGLKNNSDKTTDQNNNSNISAQETLAQPLNPLPKDSKEAIDSEVKSINQDLDSLDKSFNDNTDNQDLGL